MWREESLLHVPALGAHTDPRARAGGGICGYVEPKVRIYMAKLRTSSCIDVNKLKIVFLYELNVVLLKNVDDKHPS